MNSENINICEKLERFSELSQEDLLALKEDMALDLSLEALTECQNHHRSSGEALSLARLKIYDSFAPLPKRVENLIIREVRSQNKNIMTTLTDLYAKAKALNITENSDISLNNIVSVTEKYFDRIGVLPISAIPENEKSGAYTGINDNTVFILVRGVTESAYEQLKENRFFIDNVIAHLPVCEKGILKTLSALSSGLFIDADVLLENENDDHLLSLVEPLRNAYIIALPKSFSEGLISLAASYELDARYFAKCIKQNLTVIRHNEQNTSLVIPFKTKSYPQKISLTLSEHEYSHNSYTLYPLSYEEPEVTSIHALVTLSSGFFEAMDLVIDSVLSLNAMGIDRRDTVLSLTFGISPSDNISNEERLSSPLASALGAYRAMMELAVSDSNSSPAYSNDLEYVSCASYSTENRTDLLNKFSNDGNGVYFVGIKRPEIIGGEYLPDFELLRKISDKVSLLVREGRAASIKAFNGRISEAVAEMEADGLTLIREEEVNIFDSFAQGFIIESPLKISSIKIGTLKSTTDESL